MAPGPKKRSFHTPRNSKNVQISKNNDKKNVELSDEINKNVDISSNLASDMPQKDKYSKRSVESNWNKYEEPEADPHADSTRGDDFNVLLSYSVGAGSQIKLQDEKEWDDELTSDLSLDIKDLISAMKCIPFHERIGLQNTFDNSVIMNFVSCAKKHEMSYKSESKSTNVECQVKDTPVEPVLNIIEEPDSLESDDDGVPIKNITVQDTTENIINSLASNLSFKTFPEKEKNVELHEPTVAEEKKPETASNDLDFLLSLNISSKVSAKEEKSTTPKNTNVDDWLNSILDD